jgi:hypothetical protein
MIVMFTEQEMEYIHTRRNRWTIKDGCPEAMRKRIEKKLHNIYYRKNMVEDTMEQEYGTGRKG